MLSALVCARGLNLVVLLLCVSELIDLPVWERVHPLLLMKRMALQVRGRECVCLLSLVAHAGGYKMMVGAHNNVKCQMHVGGGVVFFGYGRRRRLPHCRCLEARKGFYHVCPVW